MLLVISSMAVWGYQSGLRIFQLSNICKFALGFGCGVMLRRWYDSNSKIVTFNIGDNGFKKRALIVIAIVLVYIIHIGLLCNAHFGGIIIVQMFIAAVGCLWVYLLMKLGVLSFFKRYAPYTLQLFLLNGYMLKISRIIMCDILKVQNPWVIIMGNVFFDLEISYLFIKYIY